MLLSIIIVNYNVKYFVEQCLRSIEQSQHIDLAQVEVFVIDNLSKDQSVSYLRERFSTQSCPAVHILANKFNAGFGKANNQALQQAKGKYVLFLNPDTLLTPHTLSDVLEVARKHDNFGCIGVRMLHTNGRFASESRRGIPTPWTAFCKMSGLSTLFPHSRTFGRYYMQYLDQEQTTPIDIVSGAFMLTTAQTLSECGAFDEKFFMYGEDIDLSYRMLLKGLQNYYCPTTILHYKGESTHKSSYRYVHVFYEAMLIFFRKHFRHYSLLYTLPIQCAIVLRALLALLLQQIRLLKKFLNPNVTRRKERFLYVGRHVDDFLHLAGNYSLDVRCIAADESTLPQGHRHIDTAPYLHIVYDMADFSTDCILESFRLQQPRHAHIGLYYPDTDILITGNRTYH